MRKIRTVLQSNDGNEHDKQVHWQRESVTTGDTRLLSKVFDICIGKDQNMNCSGNLLSNITYSWIKRVTIIECYQKKRLFSRKCTVTTYEVMANSVDKKLNHFIFIFWQLSCKQLGWNCLGTVERLTNCLEPGNLYPPCLQLIARAAGLFLFQTESLSSSNTGCGGVICDLDCS